MRQRRGGALAPQFSLCIMYVPIMFIPFLYIITVEVPACALDEIDNYANSPPLHTLIHYDVRRLCGMMLYNTLKG